MEYRDIRQEILYNIDQDIKSLSRSCSIDKSFYQLCSTRSYLDIIFKQNNLNMPQITYTTPNGWIKEFEKEKKLQVYINKLLNVVKNPQQEDFYKLHNVIDLGTLHVSSEYFPFTNLFDIINDEILRMYWNDYVLDKNIRVDILGNYPVDVGPPQIIITYANNEMYKVMFQFYDPVAIQSYEVIHLVSRNLMKLIFHRILSAGVIPTSAESYKVKL